MLVGVYFNNFKSFNEMTKLEMIASPKLRMQREQLYTTRSMSLLKKVAIYGANASGKSNFVDVLQFMKDCVCNQEIPVESYNWYCRNHSKNRFYSENKDQVSSFAVRLLIGEDCYEYGFDVMLSAQTIANEWIIHVNKNKVLYERNNEGNPVCNLKLNKEEEKRMNVYMDDFSSNDKSLFLTEMNHNKHFNEDSPLNIFYDIYHWFTYDLKIISPDVPSLNDYNEDSFMDIRRLLNYYILGEDNIESIEFKEVSETQVINKISISLYKDIVRKSHENDLYLRIQKDLFVFTKKGNIKSVWFKHDNGSVFEFNEESEGTRRLFDLLNVFLYKNRNKTYIIDEIDKSLHPNMLNRIIESLSLHQKRFDVQAIFTVNQTEIMKQEIFRRDQIWFVDKNIDGDSRMYFLDGFHERFDKVISKAYLEGKYGAVPKFPILNIDLLWY